MNKTDTQPPLTRNSANVRPIFMDLQELIDNINQL